MITVDLPLENREQVRRWYERHIDRYGKALFQMQREVWGTCSRYGLQPTIKYRVKSFDSLYSKLMRRRQAEQPQREEGRAETARSPYYLPTDVIGMRLVCPFIEDIRHCEQMINREYTVVEREQKGAQYSFHEFGYESIHYLVTIPQHLVESFDLDSRLVCEIQLRTILQDAWAEVEHELVYKAEFTPFDEPLRRKLAALNANLSLADIVFQEIRDYQRQLQVQMQRRRDSFAEAIDRKLGEDRGAAGYESAIEQAATAAGSGNHAEPAAPSAGTRNHTEPADPPTGSGNRTEPVSAGGDMAEYDPVRSFGRAVEDPKALDVPEEIATSMIPGGDTVDNLLLRALNAHNRRSFEEANSLYTRILEQESREAVRATIFIHRGMAHVACGDYASARGDFTSATALDSNNPRGYYYLALVEQLEGTLDPAIENLNRCLTLDPFHVEALLNRARIHHSRGSLELAMRDCDRALVADPDSERAASLRSRIVAAMNL